MTATAKPSSNALSDLPAFLAAWNDPCHPRNAHRVGVHRMERGRLREQRHAEPGTGVALTRHHPLFFDVIEPAILPVVTGLVRHWSQITYSSCEGHPDDARGVAERAYVGIIALDHAHEQRLERLLTGMTLEGPDSVLASPAIRVRPLVGPNLTTTAVDWLIVPGDGTSWTEYQAARDRLCAHASLQLRNLYHQARNA